jgi:peptide/nickel transport system substrate-binding protein
VKNTITRGRRSSRPLALTAALLAGALGLAACSSSSGSSKAAASSSAPTAAASTAGGSAAAVSSPDTGTGAATSAVDTLKIANGVAVDTLDPAQNSANESIWLDQNIYSRLVQTDPTGTKIDPDLASSWDISSDGLTYTFHLRAAKFSNGDPVTASDVVWSFNRTVALKGGWGFLVTPVKTVTAPDPNTVVFTLSTVHEPLLADLAMYAYAVLPEKAVEADSQFFTHPISSGPFMVTGYQPNSLVTLTANPDYYGTPPKIKTVEISIVTNDNTRVLQLESKQVDVIENPPGNLLKQISQNKDLKVDLFPSTRVDFVQVPEKTKPFDNVKVRQAVKMALDLSEINQLAYQGNAIPATSFLPYKMLDWDAALPTPTPQVAAAKALLASAGYPNGFAAGLITVSGDTAGNAEALVIKDDLAKIGVTITINSYDQSTAYTKEDTGTNGMGLRYWTNDIIDPDEIATFGADGKNGGDNAFDSFWDDPTADSLVEKARSETDATTRAADYAQVQQIVSDQVPFIPIEYAPYRYATGAWVSGFHVSPLGNYDDSLLTLTVAKH